jgi:hypothetical protein
VKGEKGTEIGRWEQQRAQFFHRFACVESESGNVLARMRVLKMVKNGENFI